MLVFEICQPEASSMEKKESNPSKQYCAAKGLNDDFITSGQRFDGTFLIRKSLEHLPLLSDLPAGFSVTT